MINPPMFNYKDGHLILEHYSVILSQPIISSTMGNYRIYFQRVTGTFRYGLLNKETAYRINQIMSLPFKKVVCKAENRDPILVEFLIYMIYMIHYFKDLPFPFDFKKEKPYFFYFLRTHYGEDITIWSEDQVNDRPADSFKLTVRRKVLHIT